MIYLVIFLVLLALVIHYDANGIKPYDHSIYWGICIVFILLAGLHFRVGGDTLGYIEYFKTVPSLFELKWNDIMQNDYQPLWVMLCSFSKIFSDSFILFQFVHAIIINVVIFRFIEKNTQYYFSGILLYFIFYYFYFNMEVLRESIAIVLFLVLLNSYLKRKWLIYYIGVYLAFFFHISAVILVVFPLFHKKVSYKTFVFFLIMITIVFSFYRESILHVLLDHISNERIKWAAITYLRAEINFNGVVFILFGKVLIPMMMLYFSEVVYNLKTKYTPLLYVYVMLSLVSLFIEPFYRFTNYLLPVFYLFLVQLISQIYVSKALRKYRQVFIAMVLIGPFTFQSFHFLRDTSDKVPGTRYIRIWMPYHSVFSKKIDSKREALVQKFINPKKD